MREKTERDSVKAIELNMVMRYKASSFDGVFSYVVLFGEPYHR